MSTKFRNSEEIRKAFQDLFAFKSIEEEIEHKTTMIMYRFLSEIEILTDERKMTRKELAQKIGTSASYITQLYRGTKLLNLTTIAKLEKVLDITFEIKAKLNHHNKSSEKGGYFKERISADVLDLLPEKVNVIQKQLVQEPSKKYPKRKRARQ